MPKLERILVPVNFSERARAALGFAAYLQSKFDAQVDLLYVYHASHHLGRSVSFLDPERGYSTLEELDRKQAEKELEAFLADPRTPEVPGLRIGLAAGSPYRRIIEIAEEEAYDLIVIGTHGRAGLTVPLRGSVADRVLRHAPCPVLSIPDTEAPGPRHEPSPEE